MEYEAAIDCSSVPCKHAHSPKLRRFDIFRNRSFFSYRVTGSEVDRGVETLHKNRFEKLNGAWKIRLITLTILHFPFLQTLYIPFNVKEVTGVVAAFVELSRRSPTLCADSLH